MQVRFYAYRFQPTLPARGATACSASSPANVNIISTHAPRTGSDIQRPTASTTATDFNPRSPHGERPILLEEKAERDAISTHAPRTGSDSICNAAVFVATNFNPRSPHGERHGQRCVASQCNHFNPRSPHGERRRTTTHKRRHERFQPTLPARGATASVSPAERSIHHISTHAPRTGSDKIMLMSRTRTLIFQPTLPARGATSPPVFVVRCPCDFNPRSPHGERHQPLLAYNRQRHFNPRSPHGERQCFGTVLQCFYSYFNPRSPHGERRYACRLAPLVVFDFNPRSPHGERLFGLTSHPGNC